jgi:hypothetical protein
LGDPAGAGQSTEVEMFYQILSNGDVLFLASTMDEIEKAFVNDEKAFTEALDSAINAYKVKFYTAKLKELSEVSCLVRRPQEIYREIKASDGQIKR